MTTATTPATTEDETPPVPTPQPREFGTAVNDYIARVRGGEIDVFAEAGQFGRSDADQSGPVARREPGEPERAEQGCRFSDPDRGGQAQQMLRGVRLRHGDPGAGRARPDQCRLRLRG